MNVPVVWYVPNIIGYARVLSALASFGFILHDPTWFIILYGVSYALDAVDGVAARRLGQIAASQFGAVLDMVTDRFCTNILLLALAHLYRDDGLYLIFVVLAVLDIVSHWCAMYSTLLLGELSHKAMGESRPALLKIYYTVPFSLFVLCAGNEAFLLLAYLLKHTWGPSASGAGPLLSTAACRVMELWSGGDCPWESPYTAVPWAVLALGVSFPLFALKQLISVVQLWDAMGRIAEHDTKTRRQKHA